MHLASSLPEGYSLTGLSILGRTAMGPFIAGRALQTVEWHNTNKFCGRCGAPMSEHPQDRKACKVAGLLILAYHLALLF